MSLSKRQKVEVMVGGIMFLLFAGYLRYIFIDHYVYYGKDIVYTALLFFVWYGISKIITNYIGVSLSNLEPTLPSEPSLPEITICRDSSE